MKKKLAEKEHHRAYALTRNFTALGKYLQEMRLKAGLTQREVSEVLEYSSSQFVSNFENGIAAPPLHRVRVLIDLYGLSENKVLGLLLEGEKKVILAALAGGKHRKKE